MDLFSDWNIRSQHHSLDIMYCTLNEDWTKSLLLILLCTVCAISIPGRNESRHSRKLLILSTSAADTPEFIHMHEFSWCVCFLYAASKTGRRPNRPSSTASPDLRSWRLGVVRSGPRSSAAICSVEIESLFRQVENVPDQTPCYYW